LRRRLACVQLRFERAETIAVLLLQRIEERQIRPRREARPAQAVKPPSMERLAPVTKPASGPAR